MPAPLGLATGATALGLVVFRRRARHRQYVALGTMHDLAVGVHPGGADAWRLRATYATGIEVGAPPDPFNQLGQNWSQPPWRPDRLAETAYEPFFTVRFKKKK